MRSSLGWRRWRAWGSPLRCGRRRGAAWGRYCGNSHPEVEGEASAFARTLQVFCMNYSLIGTYVRRRERRPSPSAPRRRWQGGTAEGRRTVQVVRPRPEAAASCSQRRQPFRGGAPPRESAAAARRVRTRSCERRGEIAARSPRDSSPRTRGPARGTRSARRTRRSVRPSRRAPRESRLSSSRSRSRAEAAGWLRGRRGQRRTPSNWLLISSAKNLDHTDQDLEQRLAEADDRCQDNDERRGAKTLAFDFHLPPSG